ncbi:MULTISPECIES: hypothetical protein [unclassified Duganella]|uniref:hypothetical protein n=1 Tax=unclassified Duganella TaxID=2636909 RepID=UPI0008884B26|nr:MULTISPECIES: hypothetical protein [unclassified Duganella]SDG54654.1 hypothetical protein SAMN05216320_105162 [Duganella sp. OV458]SDJ77297.1 hypothetical protein SAMN05428973_106163 [Duganella sp. OV510]
MFPQHLFYLTSEQLCAYEWQAGTLSGGVCFVNNRGGIDDFMDYIESHHRAAPVYILTDLVEEDFQRTALPHVGGRAGRALLQRRLLQQYRETPFRHHQIQGRETAGRRDDIVLLSALTNPSSVLPWVEALEQMRMPLAGLYSTTLLSEELANKLGLGDEHVLLVTPQSAGWRQSYLQNGLLKFSRLTPAIDRDGNPVNIGAETAKTQQFLTSQRLMARGNVLHASVVATAADSVTLDAQCEDGAETEFHFMTLESVAQRFGLHTKGEQATALAQRLADPLLLALLAKRKPESHYTLGPWQRYFKLWRARLYLYASSALMTACCMVWTGINLWQQQLADNHSAQLAAETSQFDRRYRATMAEIPPRVTTTANMRAAVNVERMLTTQSATPFGMAALVSTALENSPQIRLLQLDWKVSVPASAPVPGQDQTQAVPISSLAAGIPHRAPQMLVLEAEILAQQDDYRNAVDSMNQFARALAQHPRLTVEIEKPPVDTRSSVKLAGNAGAQVTAPSHAKFTLNLVWKP